MRLKIVPKLVRRLRGETALLQKPRKRLIITCRGKDHLANNLVKGLGSVEKMKGTESLRASASCCKPRSSKADHSVPLPANPPNCLSPARRGGAWTTRALVMDRCLLPICDEPNMDL
eukprot:1726339-Pyramimonas_sp.AAC.1